MAGDFNVATDRFNIDELNDFSWMRIHDQDLHTSLVAEPDL